jgi:thiamine-monophosphate kinase
LNKESYFIKKIANNSYIGDDGAVINTKLQENERYVYSADGFFQDVHFKKEWMTLKQIAKKSMLVNISDAIAMNALAKYALITIAIPKSYTKKELSELAKGFKSTAKKFGITIIGGDTIANTKLDISITIISVTSNPIFRTGTKKGDLLCHTGILGTSRKDLDLLFKNKPIANSSRFINPKLRDKFFYEISPFVNSALDISDGLFFELERLSKANNISFDFFKKIPQDIGCSGEEYEMLFSINKKDMKTIQKIAKKYNVPLNIFAEAIKGNYKNKCKGHHF